MSKKLFFKPWVGEHYLEGFEGVRILVLGASHYCQTQDCRHFRECTRDEDGTRKYDRKCRDYVKQHLTLSQATCNEIESYLEGCHYNAYNRFTRWMLGRRSGDDAIGEEEKISLWNRLAFSNIYQYMLPDPYTPPDQIGDIEARIGAIIDWSGLPDYPDLIIVWGAPVRDSMKSLMSLNALDNTDKLYEWNVDGRKIVVCFLVHPSSPRFPVNDGSLLLKAIDYSGTNQVESFRPICVAAGCNPEAPPRHNLGRNS